MKLRKEYKIGIVVALALAGLIWGVPFLKGTGIFSNKKRMYAIYSRVDGLAPSNSVTINGLTVGQVEKLGFTKDNSGKIIATLYVDGKVFIPRHSTAKITSSDLLGGKTIELIFSHETEQAEEGDTLVSATELGLMEEVAPIKEKTVRILTAVDSIMEVLQVVFNNGTKGQLRTNLKSISSTISNVESITARLNQVVGTEQGHISGILSNMESISKNLNKNGDKINSTIENLANISDTIAKAHIAQTFRNLNSSMTELKTVMDKVNSGKGSIGMLVNDDKLYNNLNASAKDLDSLVVDLKAHPRRYVHISVFGGGDDSDKPKKKK